MRHALPSGVPGKPTSHRPTRRWRGAGRALLVAALAAGAVTGGTVPAQASTAQPEPALLPFAATSPWRLGIAKSATFAPLSDARNAAITNVAAAGSVWMNSSSYSHPVAWAKTSDPLATVGGARNPGGPWQDRIPATARIASGTDKHMHVVTPDRTSVLEHFGVARLSETSYTAKRRHEVSLTGSGIGPQNGTRAYGGSALGGLIRAWEVDPAHPKYTGSIDHPLAVAIPWSKLKYTGTAPHEGNGPYDKLGYGLAKGYVWPATEQDSGSATSYTGAVPMGSYFAIPGNVDIDSLGLATPQAKMIAKAVQEYGAYVTDASGASVFFVEDDGGSATSAFRNGAVGPKSSGDDLRRIFTAMRVVTSNSAATPNGGALGVDRRGVTAATSTGTTSTGTTTSTSTDTGTSTSTSTVTSAPATSSTSSSGFSAKVRFQDAAATPPVGYVADWGQSFGARTGAKQGSGLSYGWVQAGTSTPLDLTGDGRVRTGTATTDPRLTGLVHMSAGTAAGSWELAVPNGSYTVTVSVGEAGNYYNSTHQVSIEGVGAVSQFVGTSANRFAGATRTVQVSDGRLTLSAAGGTNTKINYVDVTPAAATTVSSTGSTSTSTSSSGFSAKVRFQDAAATPPVGYVADWGQSFGARTGAKQGSGLSYGWVQAGTSTPLDLTGDGRVRTGTATTDPRLTGLVHMSAGTAAGSWELAVPNGSYTVTVSVGEAGNYYNSTHQVSIEGVGAVSQFVGTSANRFAGATRTVQVSDGRLTLSAAGGTNTKINYVDVTPAGTTTVG